jgi:hypothetical protein
MIKLVTIVKHRGGRQGPSARTLRRAIRPLRGRVGKRVVVFLILLSLVLATIGIWLDLRVEQWEHEHHMTQHEN